MRIHLLTATANQRLRRLIADPTTRGTGKPNRKGESSHVYESGILDGPIYFAESTG